MGEEFAASALFLAALVKPTLSAPFFWLVLSARGGLRPAGMIILGYVVLTLFAASFQQQGLLELARDSIENGRTFAVSGGHVNLHILLASLGLDEWILHASVVTLAALGLWTYRYREVDVWLLLGVAALVARFWTYHRQYDDVLILLPMVALFRMAKLGPSEGGADVLAAALLSAGVVLVFTPVGLLFSPPWDAPLWAAHAIVWVGMLIFLVDAARRQSEAAAHIAPTDEPTLRNDERRRPLS